MVYNVYDKDTIVVIPAYNEEKTIGRLIDRVHDNGYFTLVVDDGSEDYTHDIAVECGSTVILHSRNMGKGEAISTAIKFLSKEWDYKNYVLLDADMQYDPDQISDLVRCLGKYDYVVGERDWKKVPFRHRLGNSIWVNLFNILFGTELKDVSCGFIVMKKEVAEDLKYYGGYIIESHMLYQAISKGYDVGNCKVDVRYQEKSGIVRGLRMVVGVSLFMVKMRLGMAG